MALDGDSALALQVHIIKHLSIRDLNGISIFQQTVSQCTLTVVNVCNNAEITYILHKNRFLSYFTANLRFLFQIFKYNV